MPLLGSCVSSSPSRLSSHKQGLDHPVMASLTSLPHLPPFVSRSYSSSSSSSITRLSPSKIQRVTIMSPRRPLSDKRSVAPISAVDEVSVVDPPPPPPFSEDKSELIASLKLKLLVIRSYFFTCCFFCFCLRLIRLEWFLFLVNCKALFNLVLLIMPVCAFVGLLLRLTPSIVLLN